jgi:hypothetical protein
MVAGNTAVAPPTTAPYSAPAGYAASSAVGAWASGGMRQTTLVRAAPRARATRQGAD